MADYSSGGRTEDLGEGVLSGEENAGVSVKRGGVFLGAVDFGRVMEIERRGKCWSGKKFG